MSNPIIIVFFFLAAILFSCDNGNKEDCSCSKDEVCVKVINKSDQYVEKIFLNNERNSIDDSGVGMEKNDLVCWSFLSPGENSFSMKAILANGDTVISGEVYSEGGYKFIANIRKDSIDLEHGKINESNY